MVSFRSGLALAGAGLILGQVWASAPASDGAVAFDRWLAAQTNIHTWTAPFIQTRTLKSLQKPLVSTGCVWFVAPDRFRWEIGRPPETIAVRQPDRILLIYPRLKLAESYSLTNNSGPWREALGLFEAGFPRSRADIDRRFRLLSIEPAGDAGGFQAVLQPKALAVRRMMPQIKIGFATNDQNLRATEIRFSDGSTMRNEFGAPTLNSNLAESLFTPDLPPDFKVSAPRQR